MEIKIDEKLPKLSNTWVGVDIELFEAEEAYLHRPYTGRFASLQIATSPDEVYVYTDEKYVAPVLDRIKDCIWVGHYFKFDLTHLRRWAKIDPYSVKVWDTFNIEKILWSGYFDRFRLTDLCRRYLNYKLDKEPREEFETAIELTDELIQYGALDASLTLQVCNEQRKIITSKDFKIWNEIDLPATWATLDFIPFRIDVERWKENAKRNEEDAERMNEELGFNARSWQQTLEELNRLGASIKSTGATILERLVEDHPNEEFAKVAEKVIECRKLSKRASTYGESFLENSLEDGEFVTSDWIVAGTETGRFASRSVNLQNIPIRDTKEFRKCFIPREGNVLIVADYSAQEPRITAELTQDERLIEIFNSGRDVYVETVREMYGKEITKDDPFRQKAKAVVLGTPYGLSPKGLADQENIPEDEAKEMLDIYYRTFPGVANYVVNQGKKITYTETLEGRKTWLNKYSQQCRNNALNNPIQGTAGDMIKKAVSAIHRRWPKFLCDFGVVAVVHDEIVLDVPEDCKNSIGDFVERTMEEVAKEMCPSVPHIAEAKIVDNWASAK